MHTTYPETRHLMPNLRELHSHMNICHFKNMRCGPWNINKFLLIGDSAHSMSPFVGQGFNAGMEECCLIDDLIDKHEGDWFKIAQEFQDLRKEGTDKMSDFSDAQYLVLKNNFFTQRVALTGIVTDYLSKHYDDIFHSQMELIRWTTIDYKRCLSRGAV